MPEVVKVSTVEENQGLRASIEEYLKKEQYDEIAQAIGMHSILIDPQHMIIDQSKLYRWVLVMIKNKVAANLGKKYASWYTAFPKILGDLVTSGQIVTDALSVAVLASHQAAYGPFKSVEDFFLWALDDRRLSLEQVVKYIKKTAEKHTC